MMEHVLIGRIDLPTEDVAGDVLLSEIVALASPPPGFVVTVSPAFAGIYVPRMPLETVLLNLVSNAIKHHDLAVGHIQVLLEENEAFYRITVEDDGPGIPEAYHDRIFEIFQTLQPRDDRGGSGMGLSIVHKHVVTRGGRIEVSSSGVRGTRFDVFWPRHGQVRQVRGAA
jgi:signal transduction histidine kinase